jgi:type I restriction enzyme S subunit
MRSWREVLIKDVAYFQEGPGLRNWQWADSGVKVINGRNVLLDGQIDLAKTDKFISLDEFQRKYEHFGIQANDIVVTSSGTLGKVGRIKPEHLPLMMNTSVIRFRSSNNAVLNDDYLFCYLQSSHFQQQILSYAIGSAQKNFGPSHIKLMSMPLPPLLIQQRIGGILSAYDNLIENSQRRIRILETMARSLYQEWFVNFRFPGHEKLKRVPSALGEIPEGWEVGQLVDLMVLQRGFDLPKADRIEGNVPIYAANGVTGFHDTVKAKAPGVVTGRSGTIGDVTYVQEDYWPLNTALWVKAFPKSEPLYSYYVLSSLDLKQFNSGAAVPTLNRNDVHKIQSLIPPHSLQKRFQNTAGAMLALGRNCQQQSEILRKTRDLLLPRLLSGQLALNTE